MNTSSGTNYNTGTLTNGTPFVVLASNLQIPATVALNSSAASRLIEYSVDGGIIWQPSVIDVTSTGQLIAKITSTISLLRFTGVAADKWFIL